MNNNTRDELILIQQQQQQQVINRKRQRQNVVASNISIIGAEDSGDENNWKTNRMNHNKSHFSYCLTRIRSRGVDDDDDDDEDDDVDVDSCQSQQPQKRKRKGRPSSVMCFILVVIVSIQVSLLSFRQVNSLSLVVNNNNRNVNRNNCRQQQTEIHGERNGQLTTSTTSLFTSSSSLESESFLQKSTVAEAVQAEATTENNSRENKKKKMKYSRRRSDKYTGRGTGSCKSDGRGGRGRGRGRGSINNRKDPTKSKESLPSSSIVGASSSSESKLQRAIRIETRTQFALEDLQQRLQQQQQQQQSSASSTQQQQEQHKQHNTPIIITIETMKQFALEDLKQRQQLQQQQQQQQSSTSTSNTSTLPVIKFPDVRECNSALATFGDSGDILRALRLYFKMRKATQIFAQIINHGDNSVSGSVSGSGSSDNNNSNSKVVNIVTTVVPTPTLVTYSTIMSRAISLGKPQVALRMYKIMKNGIDFFSSQSQSQSTDNNNTIIKASDLKHLIVPDVKAANILMNTYAKLGDIDAAEDLIKQMQTKPTSASTSASTSTITGGRNHDVVFGGGIDVPYLKPNLVTYNTLLDACQKTGELDKALYWKSILESEGNKRGRSNITYKNGRTTSLRLRPDARTYTSLIGTVARKQTSSNYGTHDPSLAFSLLDEMKMKHHIAPNPLTYSAIIDVCGRCRRSDLALNALRLMLRDEHMIRRMKQQEERRKKEEQENETSSSSISTSPSISDQTVGAWTAAINACGKTGRIDTAIKLFFVSMPRFNVEPNVVTCGALLDSTLKQGRVSESLDVLRYMKQHNIIPTKYMYTSFMTYASQLTGGLEKQQRRNEDEDDDNDNGVLGKNAGSANRRPWPSLLENNNSNDGDSVSSLTSDEENTNAFQIYSELMSTLISTSKRPKLPSSLPSSSQPQPQSTRGQEISNNASNELYQVSMVFREMKASGCGVDIRSYNMLLKSCAKSGDINRAMEILKEIMDGEQQQQQHYRPQQQQDHGTLQPNDRTWRAVLRAAGKAKRSDMVLQTWNYAIADMDYDDDNNDKSDTTNLDKIKSRARADASSSNSKNTVRKQEKKNRKHNTLTLETFKTMLMGLLICGWDLRDSDRHTSMELYKIIIKCYNTLRESESVSSASSTAGTGIAAATTKSYMGMHLINSRHESIADTPQIMGSVLQAIVSLESLLLDDEDDEWKKELKILGVSIAKSDCFNLDGGGNNSSNAAAAAAVEELSSKSNDDTNTSLAPPPFLPLSYFDKKALYVARSWD